MYIKRKLNRSVMSDSVWPYRRQPIRLPSPWDFTGKSTGVGVPLPSPELTLGSIKYWEFTQRKPLKHKTPHHSTTSSSTLCRMPHLNNKQNKNTNPIISRRDYHLTQPCPSEEKQINKQKLSTNLALHKAYTNHWTSFRREETKRKKEFNLEAWEKWKWKWSHSVMSDSLRPHGL